MNTISEDLVLNIFEYIPKDSFIFIAPVNREWERLYKQYGSSSCTSLESILDPENTIKYCVDNGFDVDFIYNLSYDDKSNDELFDKVMNHFDELLELSGIKVDDTIYYREEGIKPPTFPDGYHERQNYLRYSIGQLLCEILQYIDTGESFYDPDFILEYTSLYLGGGYKYHFIDPFYDHYDFSDEMISFVVGNFGFRCGGCYTCQYCEDKLCS